MNSEQQWLKIASDALCISEPEARARFLRRACNSVDLRERVEALIEFAQNLEPLTVASHSEAHQPFSTAISSQIIPEQKPPTLFMPTDAAGTILNGRYELIRLIGEGGMGSVWLAQQLEPVQRLVAVKLIRPDQDSKAILERAEAERRAMALFDHVNIARVFDAGRTPSNRPYFVMEYVDGVSITNYCNRQQLTVIQRLNLFIQICYAIQHAHQRGILHRDIKPSNILVTTVDGKPVVKVIDFGVAKPMGFVLSDIGIITQFGTVVGTPEYMSPEQADFETVDIDTRTDVYSLGVVLYELLTSTTPIDRRNLPGEVNSKAVLKKVREEEAPRPSVRLQSLANLPTVAMERGTDPNSLFRTIQGELDWILLKALEKERERRYRTPADLARELERFLRNEVIEARPQSNVYRLTKFISRNRVFVSFSVSLFTLLVLGLFGTGLGWMEAIRAQESLQESEAKVKQQRDEIAAQFKSTRELLLTSFSNSQRIESTPLNSNLRFKVRLQMLDLVLKNFEDYRRRQPHEVEVTPFIAQLYRFKGNLSRFNLEYATARESYQAGLTEWETALKVNPSDSSSWVEYIATMIDFGLMELEQHNLSAAWNHIERAEKLVAEKQLDSILQLRLNMLLCNSLITIRDARGEVQAAQRHIERSLPLITAMNGLPEAVRLPSDHLLILSLYTAHVLHAQRFHNRELLNEANVKLQAELAKADPKLLEVQYFLLVSKVTQATSRIQHDPNLRAKQVHELEELVKHIEYLQNDFSSLDRFQANLIDWKLTCLESLLNADDLPTGDYDLHKTYNQLTKLREQHPTRPDLQMFQAKLCLMMSEFERRVGHPNKGQEWYKEAIRHVQDCQKQAPHLANLNELACQVAEWKE